MTTTTTKTTSFCPTTTAAEVTIAEPGAGRGVAAYALDPVAAQRLWTVSTELVGR